jgi:uncharacterized protein YehS (DUF1456 family)
MINNDVLRRLRYALDINDFKVIEIFRLAGYEIARSELESLFKKEEEPGYAECVDLVMRKFLEGLIISRRGKREEAAGREPRDRTPASDRGLTNNDILKSLRIALELKDEDIVGIMALAGVALSKPELTALFRKPGHSNYRPCGDQFLRNFLVGLTATHRATPPAPQGAGRTGPPSRPEA